jgi:Holliday junction resolvase-like predicted endonuclease
VYNPRKQGDLGELSAIEWFGHHGYALYLPLGHSPDVDLIAERDGALTRVQVKTSTVHRDGRWEVMVATRGGNQSWTGVAKYFSASRCDALFVLVGDGRRWFIPSQHVEARSGLRLGGPKYASFEVEPGHPLPLPRAA